MYHLCWSEFLLHKLSSRLAYKSTFVLEKEVLSLNKLSTSKKRRHDITCQNFWLEVFLCVWWPIVQDS